MKASVDQYHMLMSHRAVAQTFDVTYVCDMGLRGLTIISLVSLLSPFFVLITYLYFTKWLSLFSACDIVTSTIIASHKEFIFFIVILPLGYIRGD